MVFFLLKKTNYYTVLHRQIFCSRPETWKLMRKQISFLKCKLVNIVCQGRLLFIVLLFLPNERAESVLVIEGAL